MNTVISQLKAQQFNQTVALRNNLSSLTYQHLYQQVEQLAEELSQQGIRVLALHADNSMEWIVIDLACQMANITCIPLATFFSAKQLHYIFEQHAIDAIVCEQCNMFTLLLDKDLIKAPAKPLQQPLFKHFKCIKLEQNAIDGYPPLTAKVTFTSGSTGNPKGVCLSNEQLLIQAQALAKATDLQKNRHLCLLPLSTLLENVAGVYSTLINGGEVLVPSLGQIGFKGSSNLDPQAFCGIINQYQPTSLILTPQLLSILVDCAEHGWRPPANLQFVAVGGARVSTELLKQAQNLAMPIYEGYGLSECASVVSLNTPQYHKAGSCGKVLPHLTANIEEGEIVISGNSMLGYANDEASWNNEKIYTGDLGTIDHDGFITIQGRKKNLLISSFGRNINPEWVESELLANTTIAECVVLGDGKPYCSALISPRSHTTSNEVIQRILDQCNASLPDYARVKKWRRLPQPLATVEKLVTENGRPKRDAINQYYQALIESLYQPEFNIEESA